MPPGLVPFSPLLVPNWSHGYFFRSEKGSSRCRSTDSLLFIYALTMLKSLPSAWVDGIWSAWNPVVTITFAVAVAVDELDSEFFAF